MAGLPTKAKARRGNPRAAAGAFALALFAWSAVSWLTRNQSVQLFPPPWDVVKQAVALWHLRLPADIAASASEAIGGWIIGSLLSIVVGLLVGSVPILSQTVKPLIEVLRPVSPLAWVPLAIVWFGIGYWGKAFIVALITFFTVVMSAVEGASSIDPLLTRAAHMLGLRRLTFFWRVVAMNALPDILTGLQYSLATAWGGVIIAELVGANAGIGALELKAEQSYNVAGVVVGMLTIALLGYLGNAAFVVARGRLFPWLLVSRR